MTGASFDLHNSIAYLEHLYPTARWHVQLPQAIFGMLPGIQPIPHDRLDLKIVIFQDDLRALASAVASGGISAEELDRREAEFFDLLEMATEAELGEWRKSPQDHPAEQARDESETEEETEGGLTDENESLLWDMVIDQAMLGEAFRAIRATLMDLAAQTKVDADVAAKLVKLAEQCLAKTEQMAVDLDRVTREIFYRRGFPSEEGLDEVLEVLMQQLEEAC